MLIRISSVFILAVLLASSACQADLVERFVVRVKVQLAQGAALGSGCVVGNGYVLTAKHVIEGATAISVAVGGQDYPATVVAQTDQFDGPVFLQTRILAVGLAITNRLPLNQEPVTLYGFGGDDNLVRQTCQLQGSAEFASKTPPVRKIRANLTSCARTMSGDSGGPVLSADGDVMAVILFKEPGEGGKAAVSSVAETMKVYQQLQASGSGSRGPPAADVDVVTIYTAPRCGACGVAKADFAAGRFADLGVTYQEHDLSRDPVADVMVAPAFRYRGRLLQHNQYSVEIVRAWIQRVQASERSEPPGRREFSPEPQLPDQPQPVTPVEPAIDIDWAGVRFGVLVSQHAPSYLQSRVLLGPIQRLLDVATGGQVPIEVFGESTDPGKYSAVAQAVGVADNRTVYAFATVDAITDVRLMKRVILKKILEAFDDKIAGEDYTLVPDLIFKRSSERHWQAVVNAMESQESNVLPEDDRSLAARVVAFVMALLGGMQAVRGGRGVLEVQREKLLADVDLQRDEFFQG